MQEWTSDLKFAGADPNWKTILADSIRLETWSERIEPIASKLAQSIPLSLEDGLTLYSHHNLNEVGKLAGLVKSSRFGEYAFFNSNVHINPTNICVLACRFCAFRRSKKADDAYEFGPDVYADELAKFADHVDEVHTVGGLHPEWIINDYEKMFSSAKKRFPHVMIKALTAVEIKHISKKSEISVGETLSRLAKAGLDSLPGGGAEILDDEVRDKICRGKETSEEYLHIHKTAHQLGIPTNCTMLFGTVETLEQRLQHMIDLRELARETNGFQCFVPYPFLPDDSRLPEAQLATGSEIVRTIAISRLMIDTIPHIKAYRMNIGDNLAELALQYGADDIDGTVQQELIMHLAGSSTPLDLDRNRLSRLIEDAGCKPVIRNTIYTKFSEFERKEIIPPRRLKMSS